ncbi:MAG: 3-oxoacyl-[acyl-carrier-protein] synthase, KASII, partial [uncultured Gemmatimonadetes bacterium]
ESPSRDHRGGARHARGAGPPGELGRSARGAQRRRPDHPIRRVQPRRALRLRGEGLRRHAVHRPQRGQAHRPLLPVRHRRRGAGDAPGGAGRVARGDRLRALRRGDRQRHRGHPHLRGAALQAHRAWPRPRVALLRAHVHLGHRGRAGVHPLRREGRQLLHRLRLRLQRPRARERLPQHQVRRERRDDRRRHRGDRVGPDGGRLRRDEGALGAQRFARDGEPPLRRHARRVRAGRGCGDGGDGGAGARPCPRRHHTGRDRGLRADGGRLPHHRPLRGGRGRGAGDEAGAQGGRRRPVRRGLRQRARHLDAGQRQERIGRHPHAAGPARAGGDRRLHQEHDGPHAWRGGCHRGRDLRAGVPRGEDPAHHQLHHSRPRLRPELWHGRGYGAAGAAGAEQLVRLRRAQRLPGGAAVRSL